MAAAHSQKTTCARGGENRRKLRFIFLSFHAHKQGRPGAKAEKKFYRSREKYSLNNDLEVISENHVEKHA